MKAIIISDADARALLDQLQLEASDDCPNYFSALHKDEQALAAKLVPHVRAEMGRRFHYVVTRWLQEMGADTLRR